MDQWAVIVSAVGSLLVAFTGLYIAISTRKKNEGDAALAISGAAEKTVQMREKDIAALNERVDELRDYIKYLCDWIDEHGRGREKPQSLEDFLRERKEKKR